MYFHNWLKKNGRGTYGYYVTRNDVIKYLSKKDHPVAKQILKELEESPGVEYIPPRVWDDEYYNFKG